MSSERRQVRLGSLVIPVFIPSALFSTGEYALVPMIPASAERLGASLPLAGIIAGFVMLGTVLADIPAAKVVSKFGERNSMLYSALAAALGLVIAVQSQSIWVLAIGVLVVGFAAAVFALARHTYMAENVPLEMRARALSVLGGMFRLGSFAGPMLAAGVISLFGVQAVFWLSAAAMLLAMAVLVASRELEGAEASAIENSGTFAILWRERKKLLTVGLGSSILGMLRTTRIVGLPLWALSLKLPAEQTALYIGIAAALDFALFYTSGQIMDRFGRVWAAVPTLIGLGITHMTVGLAQDSTGFLLLALAMALANGLGSGVILVLGADLAPQDARSEFLGGYRVLVDGAVAASSPLLSWLTLLSGSVAVGMGAFGFLGLFGAWLMLRFIPRYAPVAPN
ncbi:MAG: MFS transporter [Actinomycetales bacterium]|nr:MFS transporter [Actinomycetales bacterium]